MKRSADELNSSAPPIVEGKEKDSGISIKENSKTTEDTVSNPPLKKTKSDSSDSSRQVKNEEVKEGDNTSADEVLKLAQDSVEKSKDKIVVVDNDISSKSDQHDSASKAQALVNKKVVTKSIFGSRFGTFPCPLQVCIDF